MAFHKTAGLRIMDMVKSNWVYRKLRNFRAGIESDISCLKCAYGFARCGLRRLRSALLARRRFSVDLNQLDEAVDPVVDEGHAA
jgi:hypothetical protein